MTRNHSSNHSFTAPQPGEIWQVDSVMHSPLTLSTEDQLRLYSEPALRFLQGKTLPRYVMVVTTAEQWVADWQTVAVMVLSLESEFLSDVDILMPAPLSGLGQDLLAETWHVQQMLVVNLSHSVGQRLSRQAYDLLLNQGEHYHNPLSKAPNPLDLKALGLQIGDRTAQSDLTLQAFHRRESAWSDVLTVPLAATQAYAKGLQATERILQEAIALEQSFVPSLKTHLSQWFQGVVGTSWELFSDALYFPQIAIAVRSGQTPEDISAIIAQLERNLSHPEPDEHQRRRLAESLGKATKGHPEAIQTLIQLLRATQDDETLWTAVESLWRLDPGNLAAGVRQVKQVDLGMQLAGESIALAVALVQKANQSVGVLLQVYPMHEAAFLPAQLKLVLLDRSGQVLREVTARQSDLYIQLKLTGEPGEAFSVRVELGESRITEDFVI